MKKRIRRVIGLVSIFAIAIVVGITSAWFTGGRTADGIIKVGNGITLTYTNMKSETVASVTSYYLLFNEQTVETANAGTVTDIYPGDSETVKSVTIGLANGSMNAIIRFKYVYGYRIGNSGEFTTITPGGANWYLTTNGLGANTTFAKIGDWYYYCTQAGVTKNTINFNLMQQVTSSNSINLQGSETTTLTFDGENTPEGYQLQIQLVIEALQVNSTAFNTWATEISQVA